MTKQELKGKQTRYYEVAQREERTAEEQQDYETINISTVANQLMAIEQAEKLEAIRLEQEAERLRQEQELQAMLEKKKV